MGEINFVELDPNDKKYGIPGYGDPQPGDNPWEENKKPEPKYINVYNITSVPEKKEENFYDIPIPPPKRDPIRKKNGVANPYMYNEDIDFWLDNPYHLIEEPWMYPTKNMSFNQKLNAIFRGSVVLSLLLFLFTKSRKSFLIVLVALISTLLLLSNTDYKLKIHNKRCLVEEQMYTIVKKCIKDLGLEKNNYLSYDDMDEIIFMINDEKYNVYQGNKNNKIYQIAYLNLSKMSVPELENFMENRLPENSAEESGAVTYEEVENMQSSHQRQQRQRKKQFQDKHKKQTQQMQKMQKQNQQEKEKDPFDADFSSSSHLDYNFITDIPPDSRDELFKSVDLNWENEINSRNEPLLSYSDYLNNDFEKHLTQDFHGKNMQWFRDENPWFVDRDIHNPFHRNEDEYFYDPW